MPGSIRENDAFVIDTVMDKIRPDSLLDVGPGRGTYADLLGPYCDTWIFEAVEVWEPYVELFNLRDKYDHVCVNDIRDHVDFEYDLVIFGDVMEHMTLEEAKAVWSRCADQAKWGMISVPIIHYPQGAEYGNPFEVHVQEHLTVEDIERHFGPFDYQEVYDVTATFFRRFNE